MRGRGTSDKGALAEKHLGAAVPGLEDGLWASCCREHDWFMPVTPAQRQVYSRYSVDAELIKEQGLGGS